MSNIYTYEKEKIEGKFWLPGEKENSVPGYFIFGEGWPRIELIGSISEHLPGGNFGVSSGKIPVIHGILSGRLWHVSLVGGTVASSKIDTFNQGTFEREKVVFDYAVQGDLITGVDEEYQEAKFSIDNLTNWVGRSGLMWKGKDGEEEFNFKYVFPEFESIPLGGGLGDLCFDQYLTRSFPSLSGVKVSTETWALAKFASPLKEFDIKTNLCWPMASLLSLMYGEECNLRKLEVKKGKDSNWLKVIGFKKGGNAEKNQFAPCLMGFSQLGAEGLAGWIEASKRLSPLPIILSNSLRDKSLEGNFVQLAFSAEGLHRRSFDGQGKISKARKRSVARALQKLDIEKAELDSILNAWNLYLWNYSFPERLLMLAEEVSEFIPGVCGDKHEWKKSVALARNGLAHALSSLDVQGSGIEKYIILTRSLHWVILCKLLIESGVDGENLKEAFLSHQKYIQFQLDAKRFYPAIYNVS
ncbi:ApeA N-terminal domain 1-containing protein [Actinorugispora endophytica]|uniref:Uncharacterized protein n=1 Tax=Actinorugispora endophytica TaxID=1605990 RepID=A0A4R6V8C0_9ACTN|nr:HEPN domain-containing protein [Actinorugispora endophytica]TDQ55396.1 hypothetical protein EV190_101723 [Actinorugispora endophytica]